MKRTLCVNGIHAAATDEDGRQVGANVQDLGAGRYRVRWSPHASSLTIAPKDAFAGLDAGQKVEVESIAAASVFAVTIPTGADVRIVVPEGRPHNVLVTGTFGARVIHVDGISVLRMVPDGAVQASCEIDGVEERRSVVVNGAGAMRDLDFTRR